MSMDDFKLDKLQVRDSFARAANDYDQVAVLQREIGSRMLERLDYVRLQPQLIVDAGAGTGHCSAELLHRYKKAKVVSLDFALPMLRHARRRGRWLRRPVCVCADIESLPFADASVDLLLSNVAIQWCNNLQQTFNEFMRVLTPGGLLMFTTFGPDTLYELRHAWSAVDSERHTSTFIDMHDIGDMLVNAHFADPVMDADRMQLTYTSVKGLVKDLKMLGAHNAASSRAKGMTGRQRWQGMCDAYENFRVDNRLPATYEVVYGHAWRPQALTPAMLQARQLSSPAETFVPVDKLKRL